MTNTNKGYNEQINLYTSRYYAKKAAYSDEIIIKVEGGYKIMTVQQYNVWRRQK